MMVAGVATVFWAQDATTMAVMTRAGARRIERFTDTNVVLTNAT